MTRSTPSTFDILNNSILSKPRMMGTAGEKETTRFILDYLRAHRLSPHTEEIEWSTSSVNGRKVLFLVVSLFVILLNVSLNLSPPLNSFLSIGLALLMLACVVLFGRGLINNKFKSFGRSYPGGRAPELWCRARAHRQRPRRRGGRRPPGSTGRRAFAAARRR